MHKFKNGTCICSYIDIFIHLKSQVHPSPINLMISTVHVILRALRPQTSEALASRSVHTDLRVKKVAAEPLNFL